jgi:hypothetical protein
MNILGEGFPNQIISQVAQRQKIYGSGYTDPSGNTLGLPRTSERIAYLNANTSWVKLVSSVNIDDPTVIQDQSLSGLGNSISNNKLAKKFVLFNGVDEDPSTNSNQRAGIDFNPDILGNNNAYGIGGNDFGILPMMGITSAKIKHENRGSIRRASVQIKAFNKSQFDIIDVLYLRLGFNILLEWGHSTYYTNTGDFRENGISNSLADEFLDPKPINLVSFPPSYSQFLDKIQENRLKSNGNYDAMFAKVCNFHWSFLPDGSYDITLDLVSVGDIIESFKINMFTQGVNPAVNPVTSPTGNFIPTQIIDLYANQSDIGRYFYDLKNTLIANPLMTDAIQKIVYDKTSTSIIWYVRLGAFLEHIEKNIMYQATSLNSTAKTTMLKFDYDVDSNLMYIEKEYQTSVDPSICVINRDIKNGGKTYNVAGKLLGANRGLEFNSPLFPSDPPVYGQIMNIYVSMSWILTKIDEIKDAKTNKVTLIDMLNNILSGINSSFGGTTGLEATIDETTNTVIIRDMNPLPNISAVIKALNSKNPALKISDKYARFELYGYNGSSASFIKDFSLTTEISPELSMMLTVGATANSTVVGENSTALSRFNAGLTDRFKETITEPHPPVVPSFNLSGLFPLNSGLQGAINNLNLTSANAQLAADDEQKALLGKYASSFVKYLAYLESISRNPSYFSQEETETYKNLLNDTITYQQQYRQLAYKFYSKNRNSPFTPSTGFIPFNLSLTMDGLSGMKIYSKFFINTKFLPANYPDNADFLIKNITHTIEKNKWFTNIESIVISKGETDLLSYNSNIGVSGIPPSSPPPSSSSSSATLKTLTNSFPLNKRVISQRVDGAGNPKIFKKTQIYLHHTAGFAKDDWGKQVIDNWNKIAASGAGPYPGAPYVMDRKGRVEQLADDRYWYLTQGSEFNSNNTNDIGIGIEVVNPGPATLKGGKWYAIGGAADLSTNNIYGLVKGINGTSPLGIGNGISYLVDENLNKITYNGNQYGVSYFPAQIIELEKLIRRLMATHNIPFTWQGKKTYDQMFPNYPASDPRYKKLNANNSIPGIYTHRCTHPSQKIDLCPNQEIIEMLKRF